jgi:hypothetical protein
MFFFIKHIIKSDIVKKADDQVSQYFENIDHYIS